MTRPQGVMCAHPVVVHRRDEPSRCDTDPATYARDRESSMIDIAAMLNAYPAGLDGIDQDALILCVQECLNCAETCTACADA
jgi:hypothetical protein